MRVRGFPDWQSSVDNAMVPDDDVADGEADKTQPPVSPLRYETPFDLYREMPQISQLTIHRPRPDEDMLGYIYRLRASTTPEDAVTFIAFAALPKMAIWWGYECLRTASEDLPASDRRMMELVANWISYPDNENRYRAAEMALFAPVRSPAVFLGLAVAWSGGFVAPNDTAPVPEHRTPRAINSAVLSSLAGLGISRRSVGLARFIDMSMSLFRAF